MIYGHRRAREELEASLPPVALLRGPASIGKLALADHLVKHHRYASFDVRRLLALSTEQSRELKEFASTASMGRTGKLAIVRIESAHEQALNALLKLLEEPPPGIKFLLLTSKRTLATIASRAHCYDLGLLSTQEVYNVLTERVGLEKGIARRAAEVSGGSVARALAAGTQDVARAAVMTALKAMADRDEELLDAAARRWDDACAELLERWATELLSGRWNVFSEAESFGLHARPIVAKRVLVGSRLAARPRLQLRAIAGPVVAPGPRR